MAMKRYWTWKMVGTWKPVGTWMAAAGLVSVLAFLMMPPGPGAFTARVWQPAPVSTGGPWINSEPLGMERLRGRVVAVEFWTFG